MLGATDASPTMPEALGAIRVAGGHGKIDIVWLKYCVCCMFLCLFVFVFCIFITMTGVTTVLSFLSSLSLYLSQLYSFYSIKL